MVGYCRSETVTVSSRSAVSVYSQDLLVQPFQVIHEIKLIHLKQDAAGFSFFFFQNKI